MCWWYGTILDLCDVPRQHQMAQCHSKRRAPAAAAECAHSIVQILYVMHNLKQIAITQCHFIYWSPLFNSGCPCAQGAGGDAIWWNRAVASMEQRGNPPRFQCSPPMGSALITAVAWQWGNYLSRLLLCQSHSPVTLCRSASFYSNRFILLYNLLIGGSWHKNRGVGAQ